MIRKNENTIITLHYLDELQKRLAKLSDEELANVKRDKTFLTLLDKLLAFERHWALFQPQYRIEKNTSIELKNYSFETIMNNIRNAVMHNKITENDDLSSIEWILRFLLTSERLFSTVTEMDNFLSNTTGFKHRTRSTGRDRIINWYFNALDNLPKNERNKSLYRITQYIFATYYSDYKKWFDFLSRR
jgi:hypothetical protein